MYSDWTPAARRAIDDARRLAAERSSAAAAAVILALVQEKEGRAVQLISTAGLTIAQLHGALSEQAAMNSNVSLDSIQGAALHLARSCGNDRIVGSEHLLYAALQSDLALRAVLENAGLRFADLEAAVGVTQSTPIMLDEPLNLDTTPETIDTARVLDANFNRAREAMRVVEDHCRFVLNDELLSREMKSLRHGLADAIASAEPLPLAVARDTQRDVGTFITTSNETRRESLADVVTANFKRMQEALRSLEEHGKLIRPELGTMFEKLRYRSYTLESALTSGSTARAKLRNARLCAILTGSRCTAALDFVIAEAAAGGIDMVQLREKELTDRDLLDRARKVRRWTRDAGVLFIVNDRPDIARLAEADGVHLGQDDMPVHAARRIVGGDALIGVSTHNLDQVRQAVLDGASYIGMGPVFPSATKQFADFPGLDFVRVATAESSLPAFALGGITRANVDDVIAGGATRIAVSSEICRADEPQSVARELRSRLR